MKLGDILKIHDVEWNAEITMYRDDGIKQFHGGGHACFGRSSQG